VLLDKLLASLRHWVPLLPLPPGPLRVALLNDLAAYIVAVWDRDSEKTTSLLLLLLCMHSLNRTPRRRNATPPSPLLSAHRGMQRGFFFRGGSRPHTPLHGASDAAQQGGGSMIPQWRHHPPPPGSQLAAQWLAHSLALLDAGTMLAG